MFHQRFNRRFPLFRLFYIGILSMILAVNAFGNDSQLGIVKATLNGLEITLDSQTGCILSLDYPGPGYPAPSVGTAVGGGSEVGSGVGSRVGSAGGASVGCPEPTTWTLAVTERIAPALFVTVRRRI